MKKQFKVPIYNSCVTLYKDKTVAEIGEEHGIGGLEGYNGGVYKIEEDNVIEYLVVLEEDWNVRILAHECLHLTNYILSDCGVYPDFQNDEPQAYLHQYLVNKVYKFYEEDRD